MFFNCCSGFLYDSLDESLMHSWSDCGQPATPGPGFLHLCVMALTIIHWSPKALKMTVDINKQEEPVEN